MATETYALAPRATLAAAITSASTALTLAADKEWPTDPDTRFRVLIDSEVIVLVGALGLVYQVAVIDGILGRGAEGTTAAGHNRYAAAAVILTPAGLSGIIAAAIGDEENPNGQLFLIWRLLKELNAT